MAKKWMWFVCLLAGTGTAHAAGRDAFSFLNMVPSARAAALGGSYVGLAEGAETLFHNPAGLALVRKRELSAQSSLPPFVEDIKLSQMAYARPYARGTLGFALGMLQAGGFTRTVADSSANGFHEAGSISVYDFRFTLSDARKITDTVSWGISASVVRESLGDASATGFVSDIGFLLQDVGSPARIGLAVQNIGPKVKFKDEQSDMPAALRGGISVFQPKDGGVPLVPAGSLLSFEAHKPFRGEATLRGGVEFALAGIVQLRAGYRHAFTKTELGSKSGILDGLSTGLGVSFSDFRLDYALASQGELGLEHRAAIVFRWSK